MGSKIDLLPWSCIHLGIEDAGGSLNNADGLVVGRDGVESILAVEDRDQLEAHVLGVHLGAEAVVDSLRLAGGDLNRVALGSQVAQHLGLVAAIEDQRPANNGHADGLGLLVGDVEHSLGSMAVDELDTEDLGLREFGLDRDLQVGRLGLSGSLGGSFVLMGSG